MLAISAKEVPTPFRLRNLPARGADPGSGPAAPRGSALLEAGKEEKNLEAPLWGFSTGVRSLLSRRTPHPQSCALGSPLGAHMQCTGGGR